jgi:ectoine hydroxylase-related dioxygenase (phytanoyl-CoA dioxygenase family)
MLEFEFGAEDLPDPAGLAKVFDRHGIVVLRGYLDASPAFRAYLAELRELFAVLARKLGLDAAPLGLRELIAAVFQADNYYPRYVHDLGTHPMKLVSGNRLKFSDAVLAPVQAIFGAQAILASPTGSDNLLFFFPGEKFKKYSLPLHQDFPYIMQSARQLTVWIPVTEPAPGVGGFVAWPGSHTAGVRPQRDGATGLEVQVPAEELAAIEPVVIEGRPGDVVFSHSLLVHKSAPNTSADELRAVQLFRFSDLATEESERYFWQSTGYSGNKGSVTFAEAYPELLLPRE